MHASPQSEADTRISSRAYQWRPCPSSDISIAKHRAMTGPAPINRPVGLAPCLTHLLEHRHYERRSAEGPRSCWSHPRAAWRRLRTLLFRREPEIAWLRAIDSSYSSQCELHVRRCLIFDRRPFAASLWYRIASRLQGQVGSAHCCSENIPVPAGHELVVLQKSLGCRTEL